MLKLASALVMYCSVYPLPVLIKILKTLDFEYCSRLVSFYPKAVLFNLFVIVEPLIYFCVCHGTPISKNLKT